MHNGGLIGTEQDKITGLRLRQRGAKGLGIQKLRNDRVELAIGSNLEPRQSFRSESSRGIPQGIDAASGNGSSARHDQCFDDLALRSRFTKHLKLTRRGKR